MATTTSKLELREHFGFLVKYSNVCQHSSADIGYLSGNTTNMLTHLKRHHQSVNITGTRKNTLQCKRSWLRHSSSLLDLNSPFSSTCLAFFTSSWFQAGCLFFRTFSLKIVPCCWCFSWKDERNWIFELKNKIKKTEINVLKEAKTYTCNSESANLVITLSVRY